jgi:hypothetical protein
VPKPETQTTGKHLLQPTVQKQSEERYSASALDILLDLPTLSVCQAFKPNKKRKKKKATWKLWVWLLFAFFATPPRFPSLTKCKHPAGTVLPTTVLHRQKKLNSTAGH